MPRSVASCSRSSVVGYWVRDSTALSTLNWRASTRLRFFLIVGAGVEGDKSSGADDGEEGTRG